MELTDVPVKVFEEKLFQYLDWNDLLRLRRVCSWTKKITDGYLKANPKRAPEIEINEGKEKSFGAFLEMGISTTKVFINNPTLGYRFYEDDKVGQFLEDYGPLITDLRVTQITLANHAFCRDKEFTFMEGLSNLKSLEVKYCGSGRAGKEFEKEGPQEEPEPCNLEDMAITLTLPSTFKTLEKVRFGRDQKDTDIGIIERKRRTRDFLMQCTRLKSISFPTCWLSQYPEGTQDTSGTLPGDLIFLDQSFDERPNEFGFEQKLEEKLEFIDFEGCHEGYGEWLKDKWESSLPYNWYGSQVFLTICGDTKKSGLKFGNVSPYWYYAKDSSNTDGGRADIRGLAVVSLVGLDPIIMDVKMPNLEKITIPSTNYCATGGKRAKWPSLKILDITVDGNEGFYWDFKGVTNIHEINGRNAQGTDNVFHFLFDKVTYSKLTEFYLKFKDGKKNKNSKVPVPMDVERFMKEGDQLKWAIEEEMSVPNTELIVKACPNLKVVKIGNWQGSNQALLMLWNGLGDSLEEVELENCGNVTDFAFFGGEKEKPKFLKLKNLRKLSLKGLDKMARVTDLLFTGILSQMKLKQLLLTSDKPLEKITKDGIMSLLQGPFAETIEKFPFQGWTLANLPQKEFDDLGKKFRSYNML